MSQARVSRREDCVSSIFSTLHNWYLDLPLCTKIVFSLISAVFLLQVILGNGAIPALCLGADSILRFFQVWRLISSVALHVGPLHILFNMLAFIPLSKSLEIGMGTLQLGNLIAALTLGTSLVYIILAYALAISPLPLVPGVLHQCVVGFSGVIFGLIAVENHQVVVAAASGGSSPPQRSLFGLVTVPAAAYPLLLLLLWQLMVPGASFLCHLSGLLAGYMWAHRHLMPLQLSPSTLTRIETERHHPRGIVSVCLRHPSFIPLPQVGLPVTNAVARPVDATLPNFSGVVSGSGQRLGSVAVPSTLETVNVARSTAHSSWWPHSSSSNRVGGFMISDVVMMGASLTGGSASTAGHASPLAPNYPLISDGRRSVMATQSGMTAPSTSSASTGGRSLSQESGRENRSISEDPVHASLASHETTSARAAAAAAAERRAKNAAAASEVDKRTSVDS
ncbi:hypothetical protein CEUSTIGMA_g11182.t1 [Chlamydomonas eustigma]|uniref:Peptidase S54 rhomboid domain-containing protein n=1 Tax=Chlamydomonas eustigma TaxID=1157962 RepID=A0A250XL08_9CHLO|nr:hypothetical protein CEUSTIGMA_g11182.t1 [Chlamydomonas eustigma]|eukprot:GAX83757.1 hypothetical protein CEUSTIGMA_g11182.t1 [Chlamydomonas eustigma]